MRLQLSPSDCELTSLLPPAGTPKILQLTFVRLDAGLCQRLRESHRDLLCP